MPPEPRPGAAEEGAPSTPAPVRKLERQRLRVGILALVACLTLGAAIFLIGDRSNLFRRKNVYTVRFVSVAGLQSGNPVQLSGVEVGRVEHIILPQDPGENLLTVEISVDSRYRQRIRRDSRASIKTLGLLGDKYIEITSGSEEAVIVPPGDEIEAAEPTDVDHLIASGEDVVENIVAISHSLSLILGRLQRGEGVVGQLLSPEATGGRNVADSLFATLDRVDRLAASLESGRSPLARLLHDQALGDQLARSLGRLERILAAAEGGEGTLPMLLNDAAVRDKVVATVDRLETAAQDLAALTRKLEDADGLLPRLLYDEEYGRATTEELRQLLERLNQLSAEVAEGDGTLGRLVREPEVYEAIQDVIVGVNESKLLRWLIRNRQKAGIEKRYDDAQEPAGENPEPPGAAPPQ